ncbi:magnesium-transporting ATPase (P-type) [Flavobacterium nitrogenifigens]|uniref:Magnesium-transporting ATPase (P-type) n=2 Tax=Flavobacterium TaxID=237 RepID=A0A7W7N5R9_9FLAO|nr:MULTISPECIES: hypothetical protein [Flavobacterium]MBB4801035.1 magnesium-transporting ATPase (P-type) [Flavobacterium nitrogenifigens]MBB6385217.1 magnesium-transporting ATPase (P-type) [Flavobacterium notoginsengisoli]
MDFNDIQNAWNNEKNENVVLPDNLEKINSANTPLDKIRKNLKNELIMQTVAVLLMAFTPYAYAFPEKWIAPFYLMFSIFVAVCVYYLVKLYIFYKRLNKITLKTKDSLYETYFDVKLNMELYKTFGFALTPFIVLFLIGFLYNEFSKAPNFQLTEFTNSQLISVFAVVTFSILFMGLALEWWVQYFYGKYAKEIRKVIDELKEE